MVACEPEKEDFKWSVLQKTLSVMDRLKEGTLIRWAKIFEKKFCSNIWITQNCWLVLYFRYPRDCSNNRLKRRQIQKPSCDIAFIKACFHCIAVSLKKNYIAFISYFYLVVNNVITSKTHCSLQICKQKEVTEL